MQARHQKIKLKNNFPFRLTVISGLQYPPHWHEHFEIVNVREGEIKAIVNDITYILKKDDYLVITPGSVHFFISRPKASKANIIQFGRSLFNGICCNDRNKGSLLEILENTIFFCNNDNGKCSISPKNHLDVIVKENRQRADFYQEIIKAKLTELIAEIVRNTDRSKLTGRDEKKEVNQLIRFNGVFSFIEQNHTGKIKLEDAAKAANLSIFYFEKLFKKTTGICFGNYLSNYRISKAEWYLANTDDTITEAAYKAGFNSIQTFNRVFRKIKGCSPTDYKKQQYLSNI